MWFRRFALCSILYGLLGFRESLSVPLDIRQETQCQQSRVLILGAGVAGVTAAQALTNNSVHDYTILEYNSDIGGRCAHTDFGTKPDGTPYTVELGANWVQGLGSPGGPENPIWTLAKRYMVANAPSDFFNISTFTQDGDQDYSASFDDWDDAYSTFEQDAGYILLDALVDPSARDGLTVAGWTPGKNATQEAIEWWEFDFEYAASPDLSSQEFTVVNYNVTFYGFSDENNYVFDQRGFNTFIKGEANTFLAPHDPRLHLNTIVTDVTHSPTGVTAYTSNGTCYHAPYAISTFSLGVLKAAQAGVAPVSFQPAFPSWKQDAIANFYMGVYTKIFLQFDPAQQFWDDSTQYFLYADPDTRGYYPGWQSLSLPGFLPGSGIFFVTVVDGESRRVEAQSDESTKAEVLAVLRNMFGADVVPEPIAFMYPRWGMTEWAYGSYSNWPPGVSLEEHQNLRANVGRLFFAGEATNAEYYGYLHAAWFEGRDVGNLVAACVKGQGECAGEVHYEHLPTSTPADAYNVTNGWDVSSFQTIGFDG